MIDDFEDTVTELEGTVKRLNYEGGYGFLECEKYKDIEIFFNYDKDPAIKIGSGVKFTLKIDPNPDEPEEPIYMGSKVELKKT